MNLWQNIIHGILMMINGFLGVPVLVQKGAWISWKQFNCVGNNLDFSYPQLSSCGKCLFQVRPNIWHKFRLMGLPENRVPQKIQWFIIIFLMNIPVWWLNPPFSNPISIQTQEAVQEAELVAPARSWAEQLSNQPWQLRNPRAKWRFIAGKSSAVL